MLLLGPFHLYLLHAARRLLADVKHLPRGVASAGGILRSVPDSLGAMKFVQNQFRAAFTTRYCFRLYMCRSSCSFNYGKLKVPGMYHGRSLPHSTAWMLFESPSLLLSIIVMAWTRFCHGRVLNLLLLFLFAGHHLIRSLIYTVFAKKYAGDIPERNVPLPIVIEGFIYTSLNGLLQSLSVTSFSYFQETRGFTYLYAAFCHCVGWQDSVDFFRASQASAQDVLAAGRYAAGVALFFWGMWINVQCDRRLIKLRGMKSVSEKCPYSVPLPSTSGTSASKVTREQRFYDKSFSTSASAQRRKRRTENTGLPDAHHAAGDFHTKTVASSRKIGELETLEARELLLAQQLHSPLGRGASAGPHEISVHFYTRSFTSPYKIPRGKWFNSISCPNYFGEVCEWAGFALAADTYAAFSSACFTLVYLTRRAQHVHKWYIDTFGVQYPQNRFAIFPGLL